MSSLHTPPSGPSAKSAKSEKLEPGRRDFLTRAIGIFSAAVVGLIFYPVARFLKQPKASGGNVKSLAATTVEELTPGTSKIFRFGNDTAIVINDTEGNIRAMSAICTHLDCTVQYMRDEKHIFCACHNGVYDLNGKVISGPPPRPLPRYEVTIQGSDIIVSRS